MIVRFTIDADGKLHITEQVQVDVPPNVQRLERTYWSDDEQRVTFDAITLHDGDRTVPLIDSSDLDRAHRFHEEYSGKVVWSVRDKDEVPAETRSLTYVIESRVSDAVIPAWSIQRGMHGREPSTDYANPLQRLRGMIPTWKEALKNPKHRFLLDYQFEMPPRSTLGTQIQLQIYWPPGWKPVHAITPDTVARPVQLPFPYADQWRVTHLFEEDGRHLLTGVDVSRHAIRAGAILGFPIVALLFWLFFVLREVIRRPRDLEGGEQLVREVVYREAPEVIEARWAGRAAYPTLEQFLRRLERDRKIALTIEKRGEDEYGDSEFHVAIRLLVSRDQLSDYDKAGISVLIPDGWETTSEEVQKRRKDEQFDVPDLLHLLLEATANAAKKRENAPWYSRYTSLAIFLTGIYFAFQEVVRLNREPAVVFAAVMCCAMLYNVWPSTLSRWGLRNSLLNALWLLVPIALMFAIMIVILFAPEIPPGYFAASGLSLALLGAYKGILASSATRDTRETARLARARRWLKEQLKNPTPQLRDDAIPWLHALELQSDIRRWQKRNQTAESRFSSQFTGNPPVVDDDEEDWSEALMTT